MTLIVRQYPINYRSTQIHTETIQVTRLATLLDVREENGSLALFTLENVETQEKMDVTFVVAKTGVYLENGEELWHRATTKYHGNTVHVFEKRVWSP